MTGLPAGDPDRAGIAAQLRSCLARLDQPRTSGRTLFVLENGGRAAIYDPQSRAIPGPGENSEPGQEAGS